MHRGLAWNPTLASTYIICSRAGAARVLVLNDDLFRAVLVFSQQLHTHHTRSLGKPPPHFPPHFWQIMKCDHLMTRRITRMEGPKLAKVRATIFAQFSHSPWCGFFPPPLPISAVSPLYLSSLPPPFFLLCMHCSSMLKTFPSPRVSLMIFPAYNLGS